MIIFGIAIIGSFIMGIVYINSVVSRNEDVVDQYNRRILKDNTETNEEKYYSENINFSCF